MTADLRVVSNIAGTPPRYDTDGRLEKMAHQEDVFLHPHDVVVDERDSSLYVAQASSGGTYPLKLERV